jgi:SAM-dependent methyltransferase
LLSARFDVVLLLANSFSCFVDACDNRRVLAEAVRVLKPAGRFLIDLIDYEAALSHFRPESWHETGEDIVVCWKRELADDIIRVREMVLSKTTGLLRDRTYAERLYSPERIRALLTESGFRDITARREAFVYHPDDTKDYGLATTRMLVTAVKQ